MIEYLKQFEIRTGLPRWLTEYQPGDRLPLDQVLRERIFFYPGSALDGQPIRTFNMSRSAFVFLYADYMFDRESVVCECRANGLRGYRILDTYELPMEELIPMDEYRQPPFGRPETFCQVFVFEKDSSGETVEGAERLVLIYACVDAFYLYRRLFAERNIVPFGILLEDYGLGCNYDRFGEGGIMSRCARRYKNYPRFLLCRENSLAWRGYRQIPGLQPEYGGMHYYGRYLYERKLKNTENMQYNEGK